MKTSQRLKYLHPLILYGPHKSHYIDVEFSHSKGDICYDFFVPESTASNFQKLLWSYFYYWPSHLQLKMFFIFLCLPKSLEYFWHFIFQEDMVDAMLGISTCSLALLAALWLFPYTWWGTCDEEMSPVPLGMWGGCHPELLSALQANLLHPCIPVCIPASLSAACPVPFASSAHPKGDPTMSAFAFRLSESVFYFVYISLYRPKGFLFSP